MKRYVTDTHCLLWFITRDRRLSRNARKFFEEAKEGRAQILVPSIVLVETIFLAQRQRVSEQNLVQVMETSEDANASICVVPLDMAVVRALKDFGPAAIPEMPDRIIAATARALGLPLLTTDPSIAASNLVQVVE